jgi:hypothetical protein
MPDQTGRDPSIALADLILTPGSSPAALESARRAVAVASLTGQQDNFAVRPVAGAPPELDAATRQAVSTLIQQLGPTRPAAQRVVCRDFPTPISLDPRVGAAPGAGQAPASILGPFQDSLGRPILIDVFNVPTRIGIQRAGSAQPFLFVELPLPSGSGSSLTLGAGSVWISADALASGVPANSYVGLRIKSGTVGFGTTVPLGTTPIVVPANATISLALTRSRNGTVRQRHRSGRACRRRHGAGAGDADLCRHHERDRGRQCHSHRFRHNHRFEIPGPAGALRSGLRSRRLSLYPLASKFHRRPVPLYAGDLRWPGGDLRRGLVIADQPGGSGLAGRGGRRRRPGARPGAGPRWRPAISNGSWSTPRCSPKRLRILSTRGCVIARSKSWSISRGATTCRYGRVTGALPSAPRSWSGATRMRTSSSAPGARSNSCAFGWAA